MPVLWFFTGFHEQYHRPTDRVETVNVPGLRRIVDLIGAVAAELRTNAARPEFTRTGDFDRTKTLWATAPSTGIVPNYADKKAGVLVADVVKDTAAARAGLQKATALWPLAVRSSQVRQRFSNERAL